MRRAGMAGIPVGLDFAAIMVIGAAQDADLELLSETLPEFELVMLAADSGEIEEEEEAPTCP